MNLQQKLEGIADYFSPKIIGAVNETFIKLVKIKGNKVPWHRHQSSDELFYIIKGELFFETENRPPFAMKSGDLFVVEKGVNHRVSSTNECHIMLIEDKNTLHTGNVINEITKSIKSQA